MNKAYLIGRLASDPELRTTQGGVSVCQFRLAVSRRFANQQGVREADFFPIVAWRQLGELCARYLSKGRQCAVIGTIQNRSYDAQDGSKRYVTEIIADEVEFLGSNQDRATSAPGDPGLPPEPAAPSRSAAPAKKESGFTEIEDDELPF
jgi:single-strand DNA-binding protein